MKLGLVALVIRLCVLIDITTIKLGLVTLVIGTCVWIDIATMKLGLVTLVIGAYIWISSNEIFGLVTMFMVRHRFIIRFN